MSESLKEKDEISQNIPDVLLIELNLVINILHHVAFQAGRPEGLSPNRTSDPGAERYYGRDIGFFNLFTLIITMLTYFMIFVAGRTVSLVFLAKSRPTAIQSSHKLKFVSMSLLMTSSLVGGLCYILGSNITIIFALSRNSFNCDDTCLDIISDASTVLLVIATILFSINEIHGGKLYMVLKLFSGVFSSDSSGDDGNDWLIWVKTAEIIAFSRVFDSAFATFADLSTYEENCLTHKNMIIWSMYTFLLILWGILLGIIMLPGAIQAKRREQRLEFL